MAKCIHCGEEYALVDKNVSICGECGAIDRKPLLIDQAPPPRWINRALIDKVCSAKD